MITILILNYPTNKMYGPAGRPPGGRINNVFRYLHFQAFLRLLISTDGGIRWICKNVKVYRRSHDGKGSILLQCVSCQLGATLGDSRGNRVSGRASPHSGGDMTRTLDGAAAACAAAAAAAVSYWFIRNWKMIHQVQGHIFQIVDSRCWWRQWAGAGLNNICSALKPNT